MSDQHTPQLGCGIPPSAATQLRSPLPVLPQQHLHSRCPSPIPSTPPTAQQRGLRPPPASPAGSNAGGGVDEPMYERRSDIVATLGVREVDRNEKYLGLPTIIGKSKKLIFACLKERIWKKLQGWKEKLLSRPGKEILIKAVAQAIPTYMMSIFKIPDGLIDEIHSLLAKFWWGSNGAERKMHWHKWDDLCLPKSKGGMGFRDLRVFNHALLAKQGWRLINDDKSLLHCILKVRYFKHSDFIEARRGFDPSYSWRSIWGAKNLLLDGLRWRVGDGSLIKVWEDAWLLNFGSPGVPLPTSGSNPNLKVVMRGGLVRLVSCLCDQHSARSFLLWKSKAVLGRV
uniref:Reverse transcriptase n=1 Tax=Chenopodium quinoa TaxID=63459 RepID=A0A803LRS4_CHEQI